MELIGEHFRSLHEHEGLKQFSPRQKVCRCQDGSMDFFLDPSAVLNPHVLPIQERSAAFRRLWADPGECVRCWIDAVIQCDLLWTNRYMIFWSSFNQGNLFVVGPLAKDRHQGQSFTRLIMLDTKVSQHSTGLQQSYRISQPCPLASCLRARR